MASPLAASVSRLRDGRLVAVNDAWLALTGLLGPGRGPTLAWRRAQHRGPSGVSRAVQAIYAVATAEGTLPLLPVDAVQLRPSVLQWGTSDA